MHATVETGASRDPVDRWSERGHGRHFCPPFGEPRGCRRGHGTHYGGHHVATVASGGPRSAEPIGAIRGAIVDACCGSDARRSSGPLSGVGLGPRPTPGVLHRSDHHHRSRRHVRRDHAAALAAPDGTRLDGTQSFEATFGGGEANVAASLARYGVQASFISRVPANDLGDAALRFLQSHGVDTTGVGVTPGRLGIYFLEPGASQRASRVIYDRADTCIASAAPDSYAWGTLLDGAAWFHTTGITPALSAAAADATLDAVRAARAAGATVSVDLNYRAKLWGWGGSASEVMAGIVAEADVLIGNEEDADKVFGIRAPGSSVADGTVDAAGYASVAATLHERFPRLHTIAFTQRGSISASENTWSGVLWTRDAFHVARAYRIAPIVDRVGAGDSFAAGLIYALLDGRPVGRGPRVRRRGELPQAHHPRRREPGQRRRGGCASSADPGPVGWSDDAARHAWRPSSRSSRRASCRSSTRTTRTAPEPSPTPCARAASGPSSSPTVVRPPGPSSRRWRPRRHATTGTRSWVPARSATRTRPTASSPPVPASSSARASTPRSHGCATSVGIPYLPGCATPTEIVTAEESGSELVKIFPGDSLGPAFVRGHPRAAARHPGRGHRRRRPPPRPASTSGSPPVPPASASARPWSPGAHTDPGSSTDPSDLTPAVAALIDLVAAARAADRVPPKESRP